MSFQERCKIAYLTTVKNNDASSKAACSVALYRMTAGRKCGKLKELVVQISVNTRISIFSKVSGKSSARVASPHRSIV